MDVKAEEAGLRPDPSATTVVRAAGTAGQGQLFADAYPDYADTDKFPAVGHGRGHGRGGYPRPRTSTFLRVAVVIVALAVVAGAVTLGLVQAGVIDKSGGGKSGAPSPAHHQAALTPTSPLVTPVSTGNGTATYKVGIAAYQVTVTTTTGRSWVSIGGSGQHPAFAGILQPNSSQKEVLLGASQVDIGAGGTKVAITSGHRTTTLTPPSAPFTYQFQLKT
jgi:hypothetical protein